MPNRYLNALFRPLARLLRRDGDKLASDPSTMGGVSSEPEALVDPPYDECRAFFDGDWYLERYPDVAAAGTDPFEHFLSYGETEGRDPSGAFSTTFYREYFMQADGTSPLRHYLTVGRALGYNPAPTPLDKYALHVLVREQSYGLEVPELLRHIEVMPIKPLFVVYQTGGETFPDVLEGQLYSHCRLCRSKEEVATSASEAQTPWFLIWLDAGDTFHSSALYCFASAINARPDCDVLYGDDDEKQSDGVRLNPFYKPDWSPDYLESCNFLGSCTCVRGSIAGEAFVASEDQYDFILRSVERADQVFHIRNVLLHRSRGFTEPKPQDRILQDIAALNGRLARTGRSGRVTPLRTDLGCYDIKLNLPRSPLISVIIPTAGKIVDIDGRKIDLVTNCLEKLLERSTYPDLEVIVIENGDLGTARRSTLERHGAKLIAYLEPDINVAKKLNLGAASAHGQFLLLLNDDVEPLAGDWIERLLEHFEKPGVGVVGARLYFGDMTTQHVGIFLNGGNPDHCRTRRSRDDDGYFFSTSAVRNFVAVTGAVMLTPASLFHQVGGYTETLPIAFNDVDYCLKLSDRGARTVYAPRAELIHYESLSRAREVDDRELQLFHARWVKIATDPYYNEDELTRLPATYEVHHKPRPLG